MKVGIAYAGKAIGVSILTLITVGTLLYMAGRQSR